MENIGQHTDRNLAHLGDSITAGPRLALIFGITLSMVLFFVVRAWEQSEIQRFFELSALNRLNAFYADLVSHQEAVTSIAAMFSASQHVTREEFRAFAQSHLINRPDSQALEWIPLIKNAERKLFVGKTKEEGFDDFNISELYVKNQRRKAEVQDEYLVAHYVEPISGNEETFGFDLASHPSRQAAKDKARDTGQAIITERIKLVQEKGDRFGYLIAKAAYQKGTDLDSVAQRREHFLGVATGVFRISQSIPYTMRDIPPLGIDVLITDLSAPADEQFLHFHASRTRDHAFAPLPQDHINAEKDLHLQVTVDVLDRKWSFLFTPAPKFLRDHRVWQAWVALIAGLLATILVSLFLRSEARRVHSIECINSELTHQINERQQAEKKLKQAGIVFENTNEGVFITDKAGEVQIVNPAFVKISGYSETELIGKNPRRWKSDHHDEGFYQAIWTSIEEVGHWRGEIWNRRKNGDVYPAWISINAVYNQKGQIVNYVSVLSDISTIKESQERLIHLAHHDPLTNLPNRLLFMARLEHALKHGHRHNQLIAVMFLDLDNFKRINDGLGHLIGDGVLQGVAQRLPVNLREDDTVARLGGDEFAIILEDARDEKNISVVARKILSVLEEPFEVENHIFHITSSLGISLYPNDGSEALTLVKHADAAMFRAKESGRNTFRFYTNEMTSTTLERLELEESLRNALEQAQFRIYYQPKYSPQEGNITGAEALIRWDHPEMGMIPPDRFIPLAEDTGLIVPIGEWVLRTACSQIVKWKESGLLINHIAVNVSGQQIMRSDFVETIQEIFEETGLDPSVLEIEITETFIMQEKEKSIDAFKKLRSMGVELAIDDFGTGYSSLAYLKQLPVTKLKIDRSFISSILDDEDHRAIATAVIALGHSLKLKITAEGIEDEDQARFLYALQCDEGQGYLYSPPIPANEFEELLLNRPAASPFLN